MARGRSRGYSRSSDRRVPPPPRESVPPVRPLAHLGEIVRITGICRSCLARRGVHHPYCGLLRPRPCKACGVEMGHASRRQYCEGCWSSQCPECHYRGGLHGARCVFERRRRRPGLTVRYDVVTAPEIETLWHQYRWSVYSVARQILGEPADAEDVVSEIFLTLLEKRAFLPRCPGVGYLLTAARHQALRRKLYSWARLVVAMDPPTLVLAEQAMYKPHQPAVTVPV